MLSRIRETQTLKEQRPALKAPFTNKIALTMEIVSPHRPGDVSIRQHGGQCPVEVIRELIILREI